MKIILATKNNMFGAYSSYLIRSLAVFNKEIEVEILSDFYQFYDASLYLKSNSKEADLYIFAGLDYQSGVTKTDGLDAWLSQLGGNPFTCVVHVAEYGDEILTDGCVSVVSDEHCFTKTLLDLLSDTDFGGVKRTIGENTGILYSVINCVNSYYKYATDLPEFSSALNLQELYMAYRMHVAETIEGRSMADIDKTYNSYFTIREEYRENYIKKVIKTTHYTYYEKGCVTLAAFYCELYRNEVAHYFIEHSESIYIAVFMINPTRTNDMLIVRTKGLPAGKLCAFLSGGKGKGNEHAGYFYLQTSWSKSIVDSFLQFMNQTY